MLSKEIYIELPREKLTFYGDTENEKKANELLFDMGLELSALDDELKEKDKEIDRLNNIINELEKWVKEEHENGYEVYYLMAIQDILDKLKELKEDNNGK